MKKANVEKLQTMAQDFLQYRYKVWLTLGKRDADWNYYEGACDMIAAFGGEWRRRYKGDATEAAEADISNYYHTVLFPSDDHCVRLNIDAWK